jgi:hypothetical protein
MVSIMSAEEMRDLCLSLYNFGIRVEIRLRNGREIMHGKITSVAGDCFKFIDEENVEQQLNYAWIARIKSA